VQICGAGLSEGLGEEIVIDPDILLSSILASVDPREEAVSRVKSVVEIQATKPETVVDEASRGNLRQ